jgi:outer membrane protein
MKNMRMTMVGGLLMALLMMVPVKSVAQENKTVGEEQTDSVKPVLRFGYLSYYAVLKGMFDYADAQDSIKVQREAFAKEMKRVEDEFNQKYEAFLEGQKDFPRTILLKRQNELEELMRRNVEFKAQAQAELRKTEETFLAPVKARLNEALAAVAKEFGLALVINTDANACPFIDPQMGMDIQEMVADYLK